MLRGMLLEESASGPPLSGSGCRSVGVVSELDTIRASTSFSIVASTIDRTSFQRGIALLRNHSSAMDEIKSKKNRHSERWGGGGSEVAHLWAKWLRHPCPLGDPHRLRAGGKSEEAHLWAKWLRHPGPLGDPHRFRAGGKIRSGPLVGKVATSPLPPRGSPPLQSGGAKSEVAHLWAKWLRHPCRLGDPHRFRAGGKSEVAHLWAKWLRHTCRLGDPHRFRAGGKIRSGPLVGKVATSPLPPRGSPPLQSGAQNQKWPTCGQSGYVTPAVSGIPTASQRGGGGGNQKWPTYGQRGYVTPAVSGIPTASQRGAKSEVAHLWAKWLRHPCRLGDPHRFRPGRKIRSGPLVGKVATSPLPSRGSPPLQSGGGGGGIRSGPLVGKAATSPLPSGGSPPLQSGGQDQCSRLVGKVAMSPLPPRGSPSLQSGEVGNQKWPTCGQRGYVTPAVSGIPTASERWGGGDQQLPTCGQSGYVTPALSGIPTASERGENQKWPTCGQSGYVTPAVSGIPTVLERGAKSEVAHLWAKWLRHPCRLGDPHRCRAGRKIRSGPLVGKVATSSLPSRGSPPLQSGGGNQKWPTCGQSGYVTPAVSRIPTVLERGAKSEVAHLWAKRLRHPCRLGDPHRFTAGRKIRSGPLVGKVATSPLPPRGSPPLQSGAQNQKWPTCGQSGYVSPAISGIPTAAERGGKSEVAHLWAKWLRHPCRLGDPHRFTAVGRIESGPQVAKVATSPLPSQGSPPLQSGGGNQKRPTCGQSGFVTPAISGIPTAAERGGKSEVAHLWAKWLRHPCRLGDPHRCRAGGKIRIGPLVGKMATSPLPSRGSPPLQSGGGNQKWPTCGQSGFVTPGVSGITIAAEWAMKQRILGYRTPPCHRRPVIATQSSVLRIVH